jgi:hypothetical protein
MERDYIKGIIMTAIPVTVRHKNGSTSFFPSINGNGFITRNLSVEKISELEKSLLGLGKFDSVSLEIKTISFGLRRNTHSFGVCNYNDGLYVIDLYIYGEKCSCGLDTGKVHSCAMNIKKGKCKNPHIIKSVGITLFPKLYQKVRG